MAQGVMTIQGQIALTREGLFGPTWLGALLALFTDQNPFLVTDVVGNHTEAIFTGYARKGLVWLPINYTAAAPAGIVVSASGVDQWNGPGDGTGQNCYGWGIIQSSESGSVGSVGSPLLLACGPCDQQPEGVFTTTDCITLVTSLLAQHQAQSNDAA